VVARVGDQEITYGELGSMMNSSAVVGVSVPALGSPERRQASVLLLDKLIGANLLYLDAKRQGLDQDPEYRTGLKQFADGILAAIYRKRELLPRIEPTEEEIQAAYRQAATPDSQLSDDLKVKIAASLRRTKLVQSKATERERVREGLAIAVEPGALDPAGDAARPDTEVVARIGTETIAWGEVKGPLEAATRRSAASGGRLDPRKERGDILARLVDTKAMAQKARAAGLADDPLYKHRVDEYAKTSLITRAREGLLRRFEPSGNEIAAYYESHRAEIAMPEERRLQMLVVKTREEADALKARIESGEVTLYEAAAEHSIDPRAKETLGEMDWVAKGSGFPALDALAFELAPETLGGPVESPAGWHLVQVLEVRPAQYGSIEDEQTARLVRRRMMHERVDGYAGELRRGTFPVEVYGDRLNRLFAEESAWIAGLERKAGEPDSRTKARTEELSRLLQPAADPRP
jgi:peptidyl-prolyl cis-trans isomerase C